MRKLKTKVSFLSNFDSIVLFDVSNIGDLYLGVENKKLK